jgi:hypothetical protein
MKKGIPKMFDRYAWIAMLFFVAGVLCATWLSINQDRINVKSGYVVTDGIAYRLVPTLRTDP